MQYQHPQTVPDAPAFEVIPVSGKTVVCDGGGGPLGHPRVYLKMKVDETQVTCPYCSRTFALAEAG